MGVAAICATLALTLRASTTPAIAIGIATADFSVIVELGFQQLSVSRSLDGIGDCWIKYH